MTEQLYAEVAIANAILYVGSPYNMMEAIYQPLENSLDAIYAVRDHYMYEGYEPRILVVVYEDAFVIYDNGIGMNRHVFPDDEVRLKAYSTSRDSSIADIRKNISRESRNSTEWMIKFMALSPKIKGDKSFARGEKGIGSLSFLSIANECTIITKPIPALAKNGYWPKGDNGSATILERPTREMLYANDVRSSNLPFLEPFVDPFNKEIPHGTITIIRGLDDGIISKLTVKTLKNFISSKFGDDAQYFTVGTFVSRDSKGKKGGHWENVDIQRTPGRKVFAEELTGPDGATFRVFLAYNPSTQTNSPWVRRQEIEKFKLTSIEELSGYPWNQLGGWVDFPEYMDSGKLWNTQKEGLKHSRQRTLWIETLLSYKKEISDRLDQTKDALIEFAHTQFGKDLSEATRNAIASIPRFERDRFLKGVRPGKQNEGAPSARKATIEKRIIAKVLDEHDQGFAGAVIDLRMPDNSTVTKQTGINGRINFGVNFPPGRYRLMMRLKDGLTPEGPNDLRFDISPDQPGFVAMFKVNAGVPKRPRRQTKTIQPYFHMFEDPDKPWKQDLEQHSIIEYNLGHDAMHHAIVTKDNYLKAALATQYTVEALAEYYEEQGNPLSGYERSELYGRIMVNLSSSLKVTKKKD